MPAELDQVVGTVKRWEFGIGDTWAAAVIRTRSTLVSRERGGEALRLVVYAGITSSAGLVDYGLVRYPGLRTGGVVWASMAVFLVVLFVYGVVTMSLSRGASSEIRLSRGYGLGGLDHQ